MERGISALKENNFSPSILYPEKLSFQIDVAIKVFHNKQKLKYDHQDSGLYKELCTQKMKANKTMRGQKYPKKPQIQAIKMVTCTLIEKTIFSKFTTLSFIFFASNSFNINLLSVSAVLNNS
jgi:hypothetical protein